MFEPMITMQSEFCRSCWKVVAPPRPNEVPRLGTVVLDLDDPEARHQLLDEVVLLVVQGGAAEVADRHRPVGGIAVLGLRLPGLGAGADEPVDDHLHRVVERELLPLRAVRAPVLDPVLAQRALHVALRGLTLRAEAAA
jgi:hypothetical protein